MRGMGTGQQGGGTNEAEIPADPEENERSIEMLQLHSAQGHEPSRSKDQQAQAHNFFDIKPIDEMAGKERWQIHRHHMGRDNIIGVVLA